MFMEISNVDSKVIMSVLCAQVLSYFVGGVNRSDSDWIHVGSEP